MPRSFHPRLSDRMADAARDIAARIRSGVLRCTDPEQTTDLCGLTCHLAEWADEIRHIEAHAEAHIREHGGSLVPRGQGRAA